MYISSIIYTNWHSEISGKNLLLVLTVLLLGFGDAQFVAPDIHRGIGVIAGYGSQVAIPYKNISQENLGVSCTYKMKYYECYLTYL